MAIALALWWAVLAGSQDPEDPFQEKILATAPAGGGIKFFFVAPVTGRLAFVAKVGGEEVAFVDGKEAVRSAEIYPIHWSSDGKRWACSIKEGNQRLVVADGVRGEAAARVGDLLFSPDGRRFAYVAGDRGKQAAVVDGVRQKEYEEVQDLAFSGNSVRFGYCAMKGEASLVVIDGTESAPAPQTLLRQLAFSADGKSVAYTRQSREGAFLVLNDRPSKRYSMVGEPVFGADGRLAYEADLDRKRVLVVDGKEVEAVESSSSARDSVLFSPDGKHLAWRVSTNGGDSFVILDGRKLEGFGFAHFPMTFSPDGKRLGYIGREGSVMLGVVDGKPIRVGEVALSRLYFSPDGSRTAFVTRDRNFRQFLVVDDKPGPGYDEVVDPVFSPDGSKCAYVARTGGELRRRVFVESAAPPKPAPQLPPPAPAAAADPLPKGFRSRIGSAQFSITRYDPFGEVAFSPDGRLLATTGQQGVRIWEVDGGREVRTLSGKGAMVFSFSPDGRLLAMGGRDRQTTVWEIQTGRALHVLAGHTGDMKSIAFSPDSKQLLTASHGPEVRLWDVAMGKELLQLPRHGQYMQLAVFSADGKTIYTVASLKKSVFAWNAADGTAIREIPDMVGSTFKIWLSRRGQFAATTKQEFPGRRISVVITDLGTGKPVSTIPGGEEEPQDVVWSADERVVAILAGPTVSVVERDSGRVLGAFPAQHAREVDLSPDGKLIAFTLSGFVRIWDIGTGKERSVERHAGGITSIVYSRDGETLATAGSDKTVRLWNVAGAKQIASLGEHGPAFVAGGKQLATIDGEKGIRIWNAADGKEVRSIPVKFQSGAGPIAANVLVVSRDEKKAAVYWHDRGGWLLIVDLESGKTLSEGTSKGLLNEGTLENLWRFTFSADGKTIVSGGYGPTAVVWNAETAKSWFKFNAGTKITSGPVFSSDGTKILTGGEDGALKSWDVATGKPAGALQAHKNGLSSFAFSPDGSILATWGWDRVLKFWDWSTSKPLGVPIPWQDQTNAMTFSPDGKTLAVGGADGTILLADVPK